LAGKVVSDRCDKTRVVRVQSMVKVPLYGKYVRRYKKYHAHDELNQYKAGDEVLIEESRPYSKLKHWVILEKKS
jgi:small subunit ribosomal protein S17